MLQFLQKTKKMRDLVLMKTVGINPVLIHGGGPQINLELSKNNISFEFKDGIRKTSLEMMNIVQKVLDNRVNKEISDLISIWGGKTTRLVGAKNSPINAVIDSNKKLDPKSIYNIPDDYFNGLNKQLNDRINNMDAKKPRVIFPTPDGQLFTQKKAIDLSSEKSLVFISIFEKSGVKDGEGKKQKQQRGS